MAGPRRAARGVILAAAALLSSAPGCERKSVPETGGPALSLVDVLPATGIDFRHDNGFDGRHYRIVETISGGVGLLDYDLDGWVDIFFTNARKLEPGPNPPRNALYRNGGSLAFKDVSATARLDEPLMSLGCAIADVDGDGRPDIYVTCDGPNRLYRSSAGGTFADVAGPSEVAGPGSMSAGCAFLDLDLDGDLDLYVACYVVDATAATPPFMIRGVPSYHPPRHYTPAPHHLYRNDGPDRFTDISEASGIRAAEPGRGLGVLAADFNGDGNPDIYVANDTTQNYMFLGDGKGRFTENGYLNGSGFAEDGNEMGSMGIEAADLDGDGLLDLCVTNYENQINNLYRCLKPGEVYQEMARRAGTTPGKLAEVAWGVLLEDLDNDGLLDLFIANGHLNPGAREIDSRMSFPQAKRLFRNLGDFQFQDVSTTSGDAIRTPRVSRGAAAGDLDNDGDVDLVVTEASGPPEVLRNDGPGRGHWCLVRLIGAGRNLDAVGARVKVAAGTRTLIGERRSSSSYLSVNDPRLHFGLGNAERIDRLEVRWPDGKTQSHQSLPVNRLITVREGAPEAAIEEIGPNNRQTPAR